jgi:hypothetical protein
MTMREMIDLNLITLFFLCDEVSDSANGMNLDLGASLRKLLAQTMNVDLDGIGRDVPRVSKDVILDLLLGNHTAFAAHQQLQHRSFAGRQELGLIIDGGLPVSGIEFEIRDAKRTPEQVAGPSQLSFQSRDQLLQRERLHQIVVRPAAQAMDAIMKAAACGKNQNGNRIVSMPYLAQQREAIAVGQSQVEDESGVERCVKDACCLLNRGQYVSLVARRLQALGQKLGEFLIVLNDQQPHARRPINSTRDQS